MILFIVAAFAVSCATAEPTPKTAAPVYTPPSIVNIPALANLDAAAIAKVHGKPISVTKITTTPENMPGEYRMYEIGSEETTLTVRFYKGKAAGFVLTVEPKLSQRLPEHLSTAAGFIHAAHLDRGPTWAKFAGTFDRVTFREIRVTSSNGQANNFDYLTAVAEP